MFWFNKKQIRDLDLKLPLSEIRKRARILVVDDDERAFPCKLLQKEGYNVQYWSKVEKLRDLENGEYDIIVLDIYGVASKELSSTDGLGILEHIKKENPAQIVIAYSGQKYDLSKSRFWKLADDYLGKPSSLIDCKEKIDTLLKAHFKPDYYWKTIVGVLNEAGVDVSKIDNFENFVVTTVKKRKNINIEAIIQKLAVTHHSAAIINVILQMLMRYYSSPQ